MEEFFTLDTFSTGDVCPKYMFFWGGEIIPIMISWQQDFLSSNSVSNRTRNWQIGLPLRGRQILLITRMITDRTGLHSALLPLFIECYVSYISNVFISFLITLY